MDTLVDSGARNHYSSTRIVFHVLSPSWIQGIPVGTFWDKKNSDVDNSIASFALNNYSPPSPSPSPSPSTTTDASTEDDTTDGLGGHGRSAR